MARAASTELPARIVEVEVGGRRGVAQELRVGRTGEGILLRERDELDGVGDEALDAGIGQVARGRRGDATVLNDTQAGRARSGLFDELGLSFADLGGEFGAGAQHTLGDEVATAAVACHAQDAVAELQQLAELAIEGRGHGAEYSAS